MIWFKSFNSIQMLRNMKKSKFIKHTHEHQVNSMNLPAGISNWILGSSIKRKEPKNGVLKDSCWKELRT